MRDYEAHLYASDALHLLKAVHELAGVELSKERLQHPDVLLALLDAASRLAAAANTPYYNPMERHG